MFRDQITATQKKWVLVGGLVTVLGFSTSFHQYDANPSSQQFAQLGLPHQQEEGILILSSTTPPPRPPAGKTPPPVEGTTSGDLVDADEGTDDDVAPAAPPAGARPPAASGAATDKSKGTAVIGGVRFPVQLYKGDNDQVMMKVQLGKDQMEAIGMPCTNGASCSGDWNVGLGVTAGNNLIDIKDYSQAMKDILAQSPFAKGEKVADRGSSETSGNDDSEETSSDDEETTEKTASEKKLAAIEEKCKDKSSDYTQLTCRMQKLKDLLKDKKNKIDKDDALAYYQDHIEENLRTQFVSFAIGDYTGDATELRSTYSDFSTKTRQLLSEMKMLQSSIASDYSKIRESLTNMSVRVMASLAQKASGYGQDAKTAQAEGRPGDAATALQAMALQKTLFTDVSSGLYSANRDGLLAASQSDLISRMYANNMSMTLKDYQTSVLNNYNDLAKLSPTAAASVFDTQLNVLNSFDYSTGRPTTIMLNGKLFQEVATTPTATPGTTSVSTGTTNTGIVPQTNTGIVRPDPSQLSTQQLQQIRGNLGRGSGSTGTQGTIPQGPVSPFGML